MPSSRAIGSTTSTNPPDTTATVKPSRLRVRTRVRAPGVRRTASRTSSSTDRREPGERRDPGVQALREVELAAHRRLGDRGDLVGPAGVLGEQLDDLVLDERGVDVHDDEPAAAPGQPGRGDGDVGADLVRDQREVVAQVA